MLECLHTKALAPILLLIKVSFMDRESTTLEKKIEYILLVTFLGKMYS